MTVGLPVIIMIINLLDKLSHEKLVELIGGADAVVLSRWYFDTRGKVK